MKIAFIIIWFFPVFMIIAAVGFVLIKDTLSDFNNNKSIDDLMRQEQLDRIEKSVEDIQRKMYKNETGNKNNISLDKMKRIKENKYPDPSEWLKNYKPKVNFYGNKFILQSIFGYETMQCVTCGNLDVKTNYLYAGKTKIATQYTCNECGNIYTFTEEG